ncbi:hypothetical protein CWI75_08795 [Kineobactrum sediminis]|uniref:Glycosyltransferase n=1 Tax=Kineobactrum sediminis TaxID=1905677 RepID=A0A2N5Y2P3_9GAMM|nr:TIGR04282 family arsenosugar biosynthesis glycosyltransferase [Kineobactrum sediminis]PLW82671.1 hypothetical protein CWI75_08795 [Kineobactrum sediminis]
MADKPDSLVLQQFAKAPQPGRVKTRMQPLLSPEQACELHCELVQWTCKTLLNAALGPVELWVSDAPQHPLFKACETSGVASVCRQLGTDLGARMQDALASGLARYKYVLLVGSDCPALDTVYLRAAASALRDHDLVLGPACDGGYVLLGARRPVDALFADMPWGTDQVFALTLARARKAGWHVAVLEPLRDIDRPEDLQYWQSLQHPLVDTARY